MKTFAQWMESTETTEEFDQLYQILLSRGFHEDFIDELSLDDMKRMVASGATRN